MDVHSPSSWLLDIVRHPFRTFLGPDKRWVAKELFADQSWPARGLGLVDTKIQAHSPARLAALTGRNHVVTYHGR